MAGDLAAELEDRNIGNGPTKNFSSVADDRS